MAVVGAGLADIGGRQQGGRQLQQQAHHLPEVTTLLPRPAPSLVRAEAHMLSTHAAPPGPRPLGARPAGKAKGFAFLAYEDQRSTVLAVDNLSGARVAGRVIRVEHVDNYKKKKAEVCVWGGGGLLCCSPVFCLVPSVCYSWQSLL